LAFGFELVVPIDVTTEGVGTMDTAFIFGGAMFFALALVTSIVGAGTVVVPIEVAFRLCGAMETAVELVFSIVCRTGP
jgi:hypothetical protein